MFCVAHVKIKSPITNFSVTEPFFYLLDKVRDDMPAVAHRQNKSPITNFSVTEPFFIYLTKSVTICQRWLTAYIVTKMKRITKSAAITVTVMSFFVYFFVARAMSV